MSINPYIPTNWNYIPLKKSFFHFYIGLMRKISDKLLQNMNENRKRTMWWLAYCALRINEEKNVYTTSLLIQIIIVICVIFAKSNFLYKVNENVLRAFSTNNELVDTKICGMVGGTSIVVINASNIQRILRNF